MTSQICTPLCSGNSDELRNLGNQCACCLDASASGALRIWMEWMEFLTYFYSKSLRNRITLKMQLWREATASSRNALLLGSVMVEAE